MYSKEHFVWFALLVPLWYKQHHSALNKLIIKNAIYNYKLQNTLLSHFFTVPTRALLWPPLPPDSLLYLTRLWHVERPTVFRYHFPKSISTNITFALWFKQTSRRGSRQELFCKKSVLRNFPKSQQNTCARVTTSIHLLKSVSFISLNQI